MTLPTIVGFITRLCRTAPYRQGMLDRVAASIRRRTRALQRDVIAPSPLLADGMRTRPYRSGPVTIGADTRIAARVSLVNERVRIGDRCFINSDCHIDPGDALVRIGDDVNIGRGVTIAAADHHIGPHSRPAVGNRASAITIGDGSWVGAGGIVLAGVQVAEGCIIGACAVVVTNTEADGVDTGVPASRKRDMHD